MKVLLKHLLVLGVAGGVLLLLDSTGIGCMFRYLTGIPCPACGTTRSLLSLVAFDWGGYFRFNPMALPVASAVLLGVHASKLPRRFFNFILVYVLMVSLLTLVVYGYRLVHGLIP